MALVSTSGDTVAAGKGQEGGGGMERAAMGDGNLGIWGAGDWRRAEQEED